MGFLLVLDLDDLDLEHVARAVAELDTGLEFERLVDGSWLARRAVAPAGARGGNSRSAVWRKARQNATRGGRKARQNATDDRDTSATQNLENAGKYQTDGPFRALSQSDFRQTATERDTETRQNRDNRDATERDNRDATNRDAEPLDDDQVETGRRGLAGARAALDPPAAAE